MLNNAELSIFGKFQLRFCYGDDLPTLITHDDMLLFVFESDTSIIGYGFTVDFSLKDVINGFD
jgi:hypothetical protein